jgi:hypothetical protein
MNIHNMLVSLRAERDKIDRAIASLEQLDSGATKVTAQATGGGKKRTMSAAARKKIAAAQKKRWAARKKA